MATKLEMYQYMHELMVQTYLNKLFFKKIEEYFSKGLQGPTMLYDEIDFGVTVKSGSYIDSTKMRKMTTLEPIRLADGSILTLNDFWNVVEKNKKLHYKKYEHGKFTVYVFCYNNKDLLSFLSLEDEKKANEYANEKLDDKKYKHDKYTMYSLDYKDLLSFLSLEDEMKANKYSNESFSIEEQIQYDCENAVSYGFSYAVFEDIPKENLLNFANVLGYDLVEDKGVYKILFKGDLAKQAEEIKQKRVKEVQTVLDFICTDSAEKGNFTVKLGNLPHKEIKNGIEMQLFEDLKYTLGDSTQLLATDVIEVVENNPFLEIEGEEIVIFKSPKYSDLIQRAYFLDYDDTVQKVKYTGERKYRFIIPHDNDYEMIIFLNWAAQRRYLLHKLCTADGWLIDVYF